MTERQRIEKIEEFIHNQSYIRGLQFRVDTDTNKEDGFVITFAKISKRQLMTLSHRLRAKELFHIRVSPIELIDYNHPAKKRKRL